MADSDHVAVDDPTIESADKDAGKQYPVDGEYPNGEYAAVDVERGDESFAIAVGDTLVSGDGEHGEVARIVRHPDSKSFGPDSWHWTVYFDYTTGSHGGCPLGELARQLSNDAELVSAPEESA